MTVIAIIAMKCPNSKSQFYSKMVWVRASVISYESSMRWLFYQQLPWNVQIWSILSNMDWICVIYFIE